MDINTVRSMIRRSIRQQLSESLQQLSTAPKTLSDFRRILAAGLNGAGLDLLADEVADVDLEGGEVFDAIWRAWTNIEDELRHVKDPAERLEVWKECVDFYVYDCIVDMLDQTETAGRRDPGKTAEAVVAVIRDMIG